MNDLIVHVIPRWHDGATAAKISGFRDLPAGWHFGAGTAPPEDTVGSALRIVDRMSLLGFLKTDAFPGPDGEIVVTGYWAEHCVEVIINDRQNIAIIHERGGDEVENASRLSEHSALVKLSELARGIWHTSDSSTHGTLIPTGAALQALHSRTQQEVEYLLFGLSASKIPIEPYASIYKTCTPAPPATLRFFGGSGSRNFLKQYA